MRLSHGVLRLTNHTLQRLVSCVMDELRTPEYRGRSLKYHQVMVTIKKFLIGVVLVSACDRVAMKPQDRVQLDVAQDSCSGKYCEFVMGISVADSTVHQFTAHYDATHTSAMVRQFLDSVQQPYVGDETIDAEQTLRGPTATYGFGTEGFSPDYAPIPLTGLTVRVCPVGKASGCASVTAKNQGP